jgi:ABC-type multidrug transport system fused ATPase/permease subunit
MTGQDRTLFGFKLFIASQSTFPGSKCITFTGVRPSGGGQSTISALLFGLYTPKSAEILIDGVTLSSLDISWRRRQVGVVEQTTGLLTAV